MFGIKVKFSGLADRADLLPVKPTPRGGRMSPRNISNEYRSISGMRHLIQFHENSFAGIWEKIMRVE